MSGGVQTTAGRIQTSAGRIQTANRGSGSSSAPPHHDPHAILVTSDDLGAALQAMRSGKTCDCGGRVMTFRGGGDPTILHPGRLRNATIQLQGRSLIVKCRGVILEDVSIMDGAQGVCVRKVGGLSMTGCEVHSCGVGVCMQDSSALGAFDLKVFDSRTDAFRLANSASVTVKNCEVVGAGSHGICALNSSCMMGSSMLITGVGGDVLSLKNSAKLSLSHCTLTGNAGKLGCVVNSSMLDLAGCSFEGRFVESNSGKVRITGS